MPVITLSAKAASYVWQNVRDHLALLPKTSVAQQTERDGSDEDKRQVDLRYVMLMTIAAFGNPGARFGTTTRFDAWKDRIDLLSRHNSHIYRVERFVDDTELMLDLSKAAGAPKVPLDFGPVHGFTATFPLTMSGYDAYVTGGKRLRELMGTDIVAAPYSHHTVLFPCIVGAVAIAEVNGERACPVTPRKTTTGALVLEGLMRQLARFVPRVKLQETSPYALLQDGSQFPTILCPLSGRFVGHYYIKNAGFRPMPGQAPHEPTVLIRKGLAGNELWWFKADDVNSLKPGPEWDRMVRMIRMLRHCARR